jgi:hypothetical protein
MASSSLRAANSNPSRWLAEAVSRITCPDGDLQMWDPGPGRSEHDIPTVVASGQLAALLYTKRLQPRGMVADNLTQSL